MSGEFEFEVFFGDREDFDQGRNIKSCAICYMANTMPGNQVANHNDGRSNNRSTSELFRKTRNDGNRGRKGSRHPVGNL
ncbi:MAG: hypothetical protein QGD92_14630 [Gammaproteobacteria bacterium]|nr:hypothetical protein [Gammaproteobacteria bacterium]